MSLSTGQILNNRYRIVKLLGQGGFGAVYRAWDLNLERPCAIKENLETSPEAQRQFKREAKLLADLEHPNMPRVIDHFILPGQGQYLVMDYVEGEDLQTMMDDRGGQPLPEAQVLDWISQICDVLVYLHSRKPSIIHRDIKPSNIKITPDGTAKLVDFGIAKVYDPRLKTTIGAQAITPGYSPPEQYGRGKTDPQSDVYALGATTYTMLTGLEPPPSVEVLSRAVPPPQGAHSINPRVTLQISAAVAHAMQPDLTLRTASASEFKAALRAGNEPVGSTMQAHEPPIRTIPFVEPSPDAAAASGLPAWLLWVGVVLFVLILIAIGYGLSRIFVGGENGSESGAGLPAITSTHTDAVETPAQTAVAAIVLLTHTAEYTSTPAATVTPVPPEHTQTPTATVTPMVLEHTPMPSQPQFTDPSGIQMALVPAGVFMMGSKSGDGDENPVHEVYLDNFYIDIYEVTNSRYMECVVAGGCDPPSNNDSFTHSNYYGNPDYADFPVIFVSWYDADAYCEWRGDGVRLPSEAEWEKAARGGLKGMKYPWGDESPVCRAGAKNGAKFDDNAGCNDTDTEVVGSYTPNGYRLYDMAGNVWEWVADWYDADYYGIASHDNPAGPSSGSSRVLRGGSWRNSPNFLRVAVRNVYGAPDGAYYYIGFRCARLPSLLSTQQKTKVPTTPPLKTTEPTTTGNISATQTSDALIQNQASSNLLHDDLVISAALCAHLNYQE